MKMMPCWMSISVGEMAYQNTRYRIGGRNTTPMRPAAASTMKADQRIHAFPQGITMARAASSNRAGSRLSSQRHRQ